MSQSSLHDAYHRLLHLYWRVFRPRTRGARVIALNARGECLLVKHRYGAAHWYLPGGGLKRHESPADGARRELREEVSASCSDLALFATYENRAEGKRDTVYVFSASVSAFGQLDQRELHDARWFSMDALPNDISPATRRRLMEFAEKAARSAAW